MGQVIDQRGANPYKEGYALARRHEDHLVVKFVLQILIISVSFANQLPFCMCPKLRTYPELEKDL